jgi:arylsulfatase A-like enzyme
MSKSIIIALILSLLIGLTAGCTKSEANLPNVVVIVIDTLRSDHLPFYGYDKNTAPFLNQLSKKSVLFEKTWSPSSWTAPATASLFTSMYPFQHGVVLNMLATVNFNKKNGVKIKLNRIPDKITTLGEVMKEQGYATYLVSDNLNIGEKENFTQGIDKHAVFLYKSAETINNQVKEWAGEMKKQERYFLYIQYMDPHMPNHERAPWYKNTGNKNTDSLSRYDSEINYVDQKIEELFRLFQWDKNTLVVFTADHGEEFWEHGKKGHGHSLYREVIQVPLFFYYPAGNFKIGRVPYDVSLIDILPTLREFTGLPPDKNNEGISLLPVLQGKTDVVPPRFLFSHIMRRTVKLENMESFSVISGRWHLVRDFFGKNMLYNLNKDQSEQVNRVKFQAPLVNKLSARYFTFKSKCKKYKQDVIAHKMSKEQSDRLKTLGYVQ